MTETDIQNLIRMALSPHAKVFRTNVGKVKTQDGKWFDTGLPKGHPDLYGFRKSDGKLFYIEVKTPTGRLSGDQIKFREMVSQYDVIYGVARSVDDALEIIKKGLMKE